MSRASLLVLTQVLASACLLEPSVFCDDARIAWGFDDHEISTADDVSDAPGLQINVAVLTAIPEGKPGRLTVTGADEIEVPHPQTARVDANGQLLFEEVEVPVGERVIFSVRTQNDCRELESARSRFVLDEDGLAVCELEFTPEPRVIEGAEPLRSYIAEDDQDPILPQVQVSMRAVTTRPQMAIRLLLLNRDTGASDVVERTTDETGTATFAVSMGQGEYGVRALCTEGPNEVPQSTATFSILVDSVAPDCAIVAPTSRVTTADDLDGNAANGLQVLAVAQTSDASAIGLEAAFIPGGGEPVTAVIGPAGQSSAVITVPQAGAQDISVSLSDLAGNGCVDTVSF